MKDRVVSSTNFGVFLELENGITDLIHTSDISCDNKIKAPRALFSKK